MRKIKAEITFYTEEEDNLQELFDLMTEITCQNCPVDIDYIKVNRITKEETINIKRIFSSKPLINASNEDAENFKEAAIKNLKEQEMDKHVNVECDVDDKNVINVYYIPLDDAGERFCRFLKIK